MIFESKIFILFAIDDQIDSISMHKTLQFYDKFTARMLRLQFHRIKVYK